MRYFCFILLLSFAFITSMEVKASSGKKPSWVTKGENSLNNKRTNKSYYFKMVSSEGSSLQNLKKGITNVLSSEIGQENRISGTAVTDIFNDQTNTVNSRETIRMKFTNSIRSEVFYARLVDDYWEYKSGSYIYYALFAVSVNGKKPLFDEFSKTTSYGAAPALMSIIPGVGQFYKGSTVKGICMLGAVAACGVGALFCDNERADYKNKMKEQPQFAKDYNTKANNYETARNVLIGLGGAIWIYNIVDAAVAKGAPRIVVKPSKGYYLSVYPVATPYSVEVALAFKF